MEQAIDYEAIRKKTLSYSSLKEFKRSPEHFLEYMFGEKKTTAALEFGTLLDKMILTPNNWKEDFAIRPDKMPFLKDLVEEHGKEEGRKKYEANKVAFDDFLKSVNGKTLVTKEDMDLAERIRDKVYRNEPARDLLAAMTVTQEPFTYTDKKTGLKIRGFKDGKGPGFVMDLKSTVNADPNEFIRSAIKYDYPLQTAVYLESEKVLNYEFPEYFYLCVEKTAPFGVSVLKASDDFVALGKQQLRLTLDKFKWALDNLMFNESYEFRSITGWHSLELPAWARKELSE